MTELKTQPTGASVDAFLDAIANEAIRSDCRVIAGIMQQAAQAAPVMWGDSIVGFGRYIYRYASGRSGAWFLTGFSPRKQNITLYIMSGFDQYEDLLAQLGKYTVGKSCLYIKRLADVHLPALIALVEASVQHMRQTNQSNAGG